MQRCVSTTVTAQSVGPTDLAVQITQASLNPCSIVFKSLQLQLQAGLAHSARSVAGMQPPFLLAPNSAQSFLFFVDHSAATGAARAILQSCRLTSSYVVLRKDLEELDLVVLDVSGRVVPRYKPPPAGGQDDANAAPHALTQAHTRSQSLLKLAENVNGDEVAVSGKLPQALANRVLYVPDPAEPVNGGQKSARSGEGHVVTAAPGEVGDAAATCVHSHTFRLELPSFSFSAHQPGTLLLLHSLLLLFVYSRRTTSS